MSTTAPRSSQNPDLSIFDTGEVLEPHAGRDGTVDFDNDESSTVLQVKATPSERNDGTIDLEVIGCGPGFVEIFIGGKSVWFGDGETGEVAVR
jgi:hypothetical protein